MTSTNVEVLAASPFTIHTFTSSGTFTLNKNLNAQVLVVAGGGGGGFDGAGGGGGGGVVYNSSLSLTAGSYSVVVGGGGAGATTTGTRGGNGGNSSFAGITAIGGGGGGAKNASGAAGGSGGGGGHVQNVGGAGTSGQGFAGGTASGTRGGGGGGASAAGASGDASGNGGNGYGSNITGNLLYYGGGGGGGNYNGVGGTGGLGGGGNGGNNSASTGTAGAPNTGGGGGSNGHATSPGGTGKSGGSGIVIIRYSDELSGSGGTITGATTVPAVSALSHTHSITTGISSASNLPSYKSMVLCYKNNFLFKQGLISVFESSVPSGYTRYSSLDNSFPRGSSTSGTIGGGTTHANSTTSLVSSATSNTTKAYGYSVGSGGSVTYSGGETIHTFTSSGTFSLTGSGSNKAKVLVVGGGGGGANTGSGGGAGGFVYVENFGISPGSYGVTVGNGGAGGSVAGGWGSYGGDSVFSSLTAKGGAGGVSHGGSYGQDGGSGSGAPARLTGPVAPGGLGTPGQGHKGGDGFIQSQWYVMNAGGGGAGQDGFPAGQCSANVGNGGAGLSSSISGTSQYYAGGGGGGEVTLGCVGSGGIGGGGSGVVASPGTNGTPNTGGGGGGGSYHADGYYSYYRNGGNGGSGIVIIRYPTLTSVSVPSSTHTHSTVTSTTGSSSSLPPYKTVVFGKANADTYVSSSNVLVVSSVPPLGYNRFTGLDNLFTMGSSTYGTTGGSGTHTHSVTIATGSPSGTISVAGGTGLVLSGATHTHSCSVTSSSASNVPAYYSVIYTQRKESKVTTLGGEATQNTVPNAPTSLLTNSLTNPSGMPKNPRFSAIFSDPDSADKGKSYQVQVNTASGFNGTMMWDSGKQDFTTLVDNGGRSEDIQFPTETLNWGVTYYWRIKMWDNNSYQQGESAWSSTAQFKVNSQPTISSLLTNSLTNPTGVLKNPKFSAIFSDPDSADKGKSYQIQVNTSSSFNGTMMWDSGKQDFTTLVNNGGRSEDIQFPTDTLNWGITYYWRIKMWDNNSYQADSAWSETAQFTMNYKPAPTDLRVNGEISPVGVDITIDPMFTAIYNDNDQPDTCVSYQIQMNTTSAFDGIMKWNTEVLEMPGPIANGSRIPPIKYNGTPMLNGITYYWRIKLGDDKGAMSDWSETATFRSNYQPNKPTGMLLNGLVNPVGVGLNPLPTFSAVFSDPDGTDVCKTYQIQLNTRRTFDGTMKWDSQVIDVVGNVGNNERIPEVSYGAYGGSELRGGTTYYWRIKLGDNKHTQSEWSDVMEFKTNYEPNAPTELLTEGQVNPEKVSLTPTFSAKYTDNDANNTAVAYQILVDMTPDFAEPLVWDSGKTFFTDPVSNGSRTPEIPYGGAGGILEGGRYYWKIRVWDDKDGMSNYSMISQFGTHSRPSSPTGLEMNGSSSPGVLNSKMMSFSAIYYDEDGDRASAYQIQISTTSGYDNIVFDSGKKSTNVASGTRSNKYYYDGSSLLSNSGKTYYWRIRFYDTDDMEGEWSGNGIFYDSLSPSSVLFEGLQMEGITVN